MKRNQGRNEDKNVLTEIDRYINHGTNDIYSVLNEITFSNYDLVLKKLKELQEKEMKSPLNNKKILKLFNVVDSIDSETFINKTSNNRLSNYVRFKNIEASIVFMSENLNIDNTISLEKAVKKPIVTKTKNQYELTDLSTGNYITYDIDNDFLSVNTKGKFVILEGREDKIKELLKEKIINPLQNKEKEEQKLLEEKQLEVFMNIKLGLKKDNYTFHAHFKDILSWDEDNFDKFMKNFSKEDLILFKNNLKENITIFENRSIAGTMNSEFDNIGSRHRNILDKVNEFNLEEKEIKSNTNKLKN
jgi:hypothetical protein